MAKRHSIPSTPALRLMRKHRVEHLVCPYPYVPRGGTAASASALGIDEHCVIKTLLFEDDAHKPLIVLMHGDATVSTKALARTLAVRSVRPCPPAVAERHSGYRVGGTSPFGTKTALPVYLQDSVLSLERVYVNAGARGVLMRLAPSVFVQLLNATPVDVAIGR